MAFNIVGVIEYVRQLDLETLNLCVKGVRSIEAARKRWKPSVSHEFGGLRRYWVVIATGLAVVAGVMMLVKTRGQINFTDPHPQVPNTFSELISCSPVQLEFLDIARMNLLCEEGLVEGEATGAQLSHLDQWAERVKEETTRNWRLYDRNPAEFEHSIGFFKMVMMGVVLAEDFGVKYDPARRASPASVGDGFFAYPRMVFLQGLLGPERTGTCSSMPVLYVAVGRRLGYPLKLVTTKGHLFVRWEGQNERFNVEVTGHGVNRFPDEYYLTWPFAVTPGEVEAEGYLESLTPAGELAVFLSIRGMCLREKGQEQEAVECFAQAARMAPEVAAYRHLARSGGLPHTQRRPGQKVSR